MPGTRWQAPILTLSFLFISLLQTAAGATAAGEKGVKSEVYSFNIAAGSKIIVENERGQISVEGWDRKVCEVNVFKSGSRADDFDKVKIVTEERPGRLKIKTQYPEKWNGDTNVDYVLFVPAGVDLHLKTSTGNLQIRDLRGRATLYTEQGDLRISRVSGAIEGRTESGHITLERPDPAAAPILLRTDGGSIRAYLDEKTDAFLAADIEQGTINNRVPLAATQNATPGRLQGAVGQGGRLIHLQVGRGRIELETIGSTAKGREPDTQAPRAATHPEPPRNGREEAVVAEQSPARPPAEDPASSEPAHTPRRMEKVDSERKSAGDATPVAGISRPGGVTFSVATNLVTLNANIKDRATGRTINNLRRTDFEIYEDHVRQEVAHFSPVDTPYHLLLLLDISGSVRNQFHIIQEASIQFTRRLRPQDRIAVAVFNSRFKMLADFTNDRAVLSQAIMGASPGGGTAFYDAMQQAVTNVFRGVQGRKAIVVFTDGIDNQHQSGWRGQGSRTTFPELFRQIEESDITVYSIFLDTEADTHAGVYTGGGISVDLSQVVIDILRGGGGGTRTRPRGRVSRPSESALYQQAKQELNTIADQTGGGFYAPKSASDLRGVYDQIVDELSVQYSLGYYPGNSVEDGKWRRTSVRIIDHPEYVARTRKGYYANFRSQASPVLKGDSR